MACTLNVFHVLVIPILEPVLRFKMSGTLKASFILVVVGFIARFIALDQFVSAFICTTFIAMVSSPLMMSSQSLLKMMNAQFQKIAQLLSTLLSTIMTSLTILYCLYWIADETRDHNILVHIRNINKIITIVVTVMCALGFALLQYLTTDVNSCRKFIPLEEDVKLFFETLQQKKG